MWYYRDARAGGALLGAGLIAIYLVDLLFDVAPRWTLLRIVFVIAGVSALVALMFHFYPRSAPQHRAAVQRHR